MKNKWNVEIGGMQLTVHTDYEESYVKELAESASAALEEVLQASRRSSKLDAALLLLLDKFDENKRLEAENGKLKHELESVKLDLEIATIEKEKLANKTNG